MEDFVRATWRTSSHSHPQGEQCVEVAPLESNAIAIRDSKYREGGAHITSRDTWLAFIAHVKLNM